jgi:ribonuclease HI
MSYDPYALVIHIDGSAQQNPGGKCGIAGIAVFPDKSNREPENIFMAGFSASTNQRAEILACIEALAWIRENFRLHSPSRVIIVTDSQYLLTGWKTAASWRRDKWRTRSGRPVDNADLWKRLISARLMTGIRTDLTWERGKSSPIQKAVDTGAKAAAKAGDHNRDYGFHAGKISRTRSREGAASLYPAKGQEEIIKVYRKGSIFRTAGMLAKIFFERCSPEDHVCISKHYAYISPSLEVQVHRNHFYKVIFNSNIDFPVIVSVQMEISPDE